MARLVIEISGKNAEQQLKALDRAAKKFGGTTKRMGNEVETADRKARKLATGLKLVATSVAAVALIRLARDAVTARLEMEKLERVIKPDSMKFLREESDRLGLSFLETAQSFKGLEAAARGTVLEGQAARDIFTSVAEASTVLGLSADQTSGALTAIEQIISKGVVSAEELRGQLGERLPGAFQIASRAVGVTTQELGKMLQKGEVLSDDFLPKFAVELRKTFAAELPSAVESSQAAFNRLSTAVFDLKAIVGASLTPALADLAEKLVAVADADFSGVLDSIEVAAKGAAAAVTLFAGAQALASGRAALGAMEALQLVWVGLRIKIMESTVAMGLFTAATGPIGLIAIAVAAITAGITAWANEIDKQHDAILSSVGVYQETAKTVSDILLTEKKITKELADQVTNRELSVRGIRSGLVSELATLRAEIAALGVDYGFVFQNMQGRAVLLERELQNVTNEHRTLQTAVLKLADGARVLATETESVATNLGNVDDAARDAVRSVGALGDSLFVPPDVIGNLWFPPGTVDEIVRRAGEGHAEAARQLAASHFMPPDAIGLLWFPPGTADAMAREAANQNAGEVVGEEFGQDFGEIAGQVAAQLISEALINDIDAEGIGTILGGAIGTAVGGQAGGAIGSVIGGLVGGRIGTDNAAEAAARQADALATSLERLAAAIRASLPALVGRVITVFEDYAHLIDATGEAGAAAASQLDQLRNSIFGVVEGLADMLQAAIEFNEQAQAVMERGQRTVFGEVVGEEIQIEMIDLTSLAQQLAAQFAGVNFELVSTRATAEGLRAAVIGLGLGAQETAEILSTIDFGERAAEVDQAAATLAPLFELWEQSGLMQAEFAQERAVLEQLQAGIALERVRLEATALGFWTEAMQEVFETLSVWVGNIDNFIQKIEERTINALNVLSPLFSLWERSGIMQLEMANERARLEQLQAQITLERVRIEAIGLDLWTDVLQEVFEALSVWISNIENFLVEIPNINVNTNIGGGRGGGGRGRGRRQRRDETPLDLGGDLVAEGPDASDFRRLVETLTGLANEPAFNTLNDRMRELKDTFFGPEGFAAEAKRLGVDMALVVQAFRQQQQNLISEANRGIIRFLEGLGTSAFNPGGLGARFGAAQASFDQLLRAAQGGDLNARAELGGAAQSLLDLAQQRFGNTRRFRRIFEEVQGSLEGIVADTPETQQLKLSEERNRLLSIIAGEKPGSFSNLTPFDRGDRELAREIRALRKSNEAAQTFTDLQAQKQTMLAEAAARDRKAQLSATENLGKRPATLRANARGL